MPGWPSRMNWRRQQMENFTIRRPIEGARPIDGAANVFAVDLAHAIAEIKTAAGIEAANMRPAYAHDALVDIGASHTLGLLAGRFARLWPPEPVR